MKKLSLISGLVLLLIGMQNCPLQAIAARGGRGGGGARGGGAPRAAPRPQGNTARINKNLNRTPSMSPPLNARQQPARLPHTPQRSMPSQKTTRQQMPQRPNVAEYRRPQPQRATFANQAKSRNETRQFTNTLRNVTGNYPKRMQTPRDFNSTMQNQTRTNRQTSSRVADNVRQRYPGANQWFNEGFFDRHGSYDFLRHGQANWWGAPGWDTVANWLPYGWQYPYYYYYPGYVDYGYPPASDLYLQLTSQAMPQQTEQIPANQGVVETDAGSWMPLGVFALGVSEKDAAYTNFFIQLTVNSAGDLAGTYYNAATDEARPLSGTIDKATQQAVWKISDKPDSPVMMTGLYNLTQEMTPLQVYFANEVQQWVLVRVNK